jgi:hypothetical protein
LSLLTGLVGLQELVSKSLGVFGVEDADDKGDGVAALLQLDLGLDEGVMAVLGADNGQEDAAGGLGEPLLLDGRSAPSQAATVNPPRNGKPDGATSTVEPTAERTVSLTKWP